MIKKANAFTIVELLIVIVVIAILAAISIVAYTGIQNRTYDAAVKNDLSNMARKIQLDAVDRGSYILGSGTVGSGNSMVFYGFKFGPSKGSYDASVSNFGYCTGLVDGRREFRIQAKSKSGKVFRYDSIQGLQDTGSTTMPSPASGAYCTDFTDRSFSYGYYHVTQEWLTWID